MTERYLSRLGKTELLLKIIIIIIIIITFFFLEGPKTEGVVDLPTSK